MILETRISIGARIVMIQESFIGSQEIYYSGFNFYWSPKQKNKIQVITAVRKDLRNKIMVDHRIDLIHYSNFILLKICKLNLQSKKLKRKMQVVNIYDN